MPTALSVLGAVLASLSLTTLGIGASGGIYGLFGVGLVLLAGPKPFSHTLAWIAIAWKVCWGLVDYMDDVTVGQVAHLGGLLAGTLVGLKFRNRVPDLGARRPYHRLLAASVAGIVLGTVLHDTRWAPAAHATLARIEEKRGMNDEAFRRWMQTAEMANAGRPVEAPLIKEASVYVSIGPGKCDPAAIEMLERLSPDLKDPLDYRLLAYLQCRGSVRDDRAAYYNLSAANDRDPNDEVTLALMSRLHATSSDTLVGNSVLARRYAWLAADEAGAPSTFSAKTLAMAYGAAGEDSVAVVLMRLAVQLSDDRYRAGYEAELAGMVERLRRSEAETAGPANRPAVVSTAALPPTARRRSAR